MLSTTWEGRVYPGSRPGREQRQALGGPPPPCNSAIRDNEDYTKVLLYSYYTTITGRGVLLRQAQQLYLFSGKAQDLGLAVNVVLMDQSVLAKVLSRYLDDQTCYT